MDPNPFFGVVLHAIGGFAAGSFYIPYKQVKKWSWESYWLVGGVFSWIIAPWIVALIAVPHLARTPDRQGWNRFASLQRRRRGATSSARRVDHPDRELALQTGFFQRSARPSARQRTALLPVTEQKS